MNEQNYQIELICVNCSNKWNEEFPKGFPCEEYGYSKKLILRPDGKHVGCPICGGTDVRKVLTKERGNK